VTHRLGPMTLITAGRCETVHVSAMARKVRELMSDLEQAAYINRGG
jgi:hypothetical protein